MADVSDILEGPMQLRIVDGRIESIIKTDIVESSGGTAIERLAAATQKPIVPTPDATVTVLGQTLRVREQEVVRHESDKNVSLFKVTTEFGPYGDHGGGDSRAQMVSGGTRSVSIETQKDRDGNPITVSHLEEQQGGAVMVTLSQSYVVYESIEETNIPGVLAEQYNNKVNEETWNGGEPGTWRCDDVSFDPVSLTSDPAVFKMRWVFLRDNEGWQPTVFFRDPATGKPPVNPVEGEAIKDIEYYQYASFAAKFPEPPGP